MAIVNRTRILALALLLGATAGTAMAGDRTATQASFDRSIGKSGVGGGGTDAAKHAAELRAIKDAENAAVWRGIIDGIVGGGASEGQPGGPCGCSPDRSGGQGAANGF